jgi:hypothetical protein
MIFQFTSAYPCPLLSNCCASFVKLSKTLELQSDCPEGNGIPAPFHENDSKRIYQPEKKPDRG